MRRVRQRGEIVSALFILPPGCSPRLFGPCLTFLPAAPTGLVSAGQFCCWFLSLLCRVSTQPPPLRRPRISGADPPFPFHAENAAWSRSGQRGNPGQRGGESDLWAAAHLTPSRPARTVPVSWRMAGDGSLVGSAKDDLPGCPVPGFKSQNEILLENCKEAQ